jgi:acyl carrier protein
MSAQDVEVKVREIVAHILRVSPEQLRLETRFREDLGADSLILVELIYELEQEFDITIPDERAQKVRTVGEAIAALTDAKQ